MFDDTKHYDLRTAVVEGITHYFVSFSDGQAVSRETEVSRPVYLEFLHFVSYERNLRRWDERHLERLSLTDEMLYERALCPQKSIEDTAFDSLRNEQLRLAVQQLPEIQRRRFVLYHEFGLTYGQIAEIEGCHFTSARESIQRAKEKIKEKIK